MRKRIDSDLQNFFGYSFPIIVSSIISFIAVPIFTRIFEPNILGQINLFSTYGTIVVSIALLGLNQGLIRFYREPPGRNLSNALYKLCLVIVSVSSFIIVILIIIFRSYLSFSIAGVYNLTLIIFLIIYVVSFAIITISNSFYRVSGAIVVFGIMSIITNFASKLSFLGAVFFQDKFLTAIMLLSGSFLVLAIVNFLLTFKSIKGVSTFYGRKEIFPLLSFSLPLVPALFISQVNTAIPKIVISNVLDFNEVGIFAAAFSVVSILSILQSAINVFWAPFVYKNYISNPSSLRTGQVYITFFIILFAMGVILFQDIIYQIIGEKYKDSQVFFSLLLASPIFYTISETTGVGINISKKTYLNILIYLFSSALTFILSVPLIKNYGLYGAGISVSLAAFMMFVIKSVIGEKYYKVFGNYKQTFSSIFLFILCVLMNSVLYDFQIIRVILTIIMILIICLLHIKEVRNILKICIDYLGQRR